MEHLRRRLSCRLVEFWAKLSSRLSEFLCRLCRHSYMHDFYPQAVLTPPWRFGPECPKCSCRWLEHEIQNAPLIIKLRVLRQQGPLNLINHRVCDTSGPGHRREHVSTLCLAEYGSSYGWQGDVRQARRTLQHEGYVLSIYVDILMD